MHFGWCARPDSLPYSGVVAESQWTNLEQGAIALHELFLTLQKAGFTESQALSVVAKLIANPGEDEDGESGS